MDDARRRALIKQQIALKKWQKGQTPKGMGSANLSTKSKQPEKIGHLPKKPKNVPELVMGLQAEAKKTVNHPSHGKGKGLMTSSIPVIEKPPVLFCKDFKYALEQLSSIITAYDYEDLSNHTTETMGETGFFSIAQVTMSVHFLFSFFLSFNLPCY